jgi:hypothetical protein
MRSSRESRQWTELQRLVWSTTPPVMRTRCCLSSGCRGLALRYRAAVIIGRVAVCSGCCSLTCRVVVSGPLPSWIWLSENLSGNTTSTCAAVTILPSLAVIIYDSQRRLNNLTLNKSRTLCHIWHSRATEASYGRVWALVLRKHIQQLVSDAVEVLPDYPQ